MQQIVEKELGEEMMKRVEVFRDLLARTPVDELEVRSRQAQLSRAINGMFRSLAKVTRD